MPPRRPTKAEKLQAAIDAKLAALSLAEEDTNKPQPIGVPQNYFAARPQTDTTSGYPVLSPFDPAQGIMAPSDVYPYTAPRYYEGAEWEPASWAKDKIIALQQKLETLGLKGYTPGSWDPKSMAAYRQVLAMANGSGRTWEQELADIEANGGLPGEGSRRDPNVVTLSNPDDLRAVIQAGAQQLFGKYLDPALVERYISGYRAQEAAADNARYAMTGYDPATGAQTSATPQGGTITGPPTSAGGINLQIERQMREEHPVNSQVADFVSHFGDLIGVLTK